MQQTDTERQETDHAAHVILLSSSATPGDFQVGFASEVMNDTGNSH